MINSGREPLAIVDLTKHPLTKEMELTKHFKSYLGTPIMKRDGSVIGTLCAIDAVPYDFSEKEIKMIQTMSYYLSNLIELDEEIEQKKQAEELVSAHNLILTEIAQGQSISRVLNDICIKVEQIVKGVRCTILKFNHSTNNLQLISAPSLSNEFKDKLGVIPVDRNEGSCGAAAFNKEMVNVPNINENPMWVRYKEIVLKEGFQACISFPIFSSKGDLLGTFAIYYPKEKHLLDSEIKFFQQFSSLASIALEKKANEDKIHFIAYHDELTKLPNRLHFKERVALAFNQAMLNAGTVALMILDLDNFKTINDSYGHLYGDEVLKELSFRLSNCILDKGMVARWGGDEFVLVFNNASDPFLEELSKQIIEEISKPVSFQGVELCVTTSIGISRFPTDGTTLSDLLKFADYAMYQAKDNGKNNFAFYTSRSY